MMTTIFIADDHVFMREALAELLWQAGFEVVGSAGDGREAVRQIPKLAPDIVVMDISMPDMNGIEAARQLRECAPNVLIVILSMHSTAEHVFHALEAGVRGYILKESAGEEIVHAVEVVRAGGLFLSPKVARVVAAQVGMQPRGSPLEKLSKREREILQLVAEGYSSAQIAGVLSISPKTVDTYRSRLMQKLSIGDVPGLVKFAIQQGLTSLE